jgi:hypothetical protein
MFDVTQSYNSVSSFSKYTGIRRVFMGIVWSVNQKFIFAKKHIFSPTKVNLENEDNLYGACSNPTNVALVIVLGIIIGKYA